MALLDWGWPGEAERRFTLTDYVAGRLERALGFLAPERPVLEQFGVALQPEVQVLGPVGMPDEEIATTLGMPVGIVKSTLHRALARNEDEIAGAHPRHVIGDGLGCHGKGDAEFGQALVDLCNLHPQWSGQVGQAAARLGLGLPVVPAR